MKTVKTLAAALMIALCSLSLAKAEPKAADAMGEQELKKMLENLGYDPKPAALANNRTGYWIDIRFNNQAAAMFMQVSSDGSQIWGTLTLAELKSEHNADASRFIKLLQLNQQYGPCHFYVSPDGKCLYLTRALYNKSVGAKELRTIIDSLVGTATATSAEWNTLQWGTPPAAPQVNEMK